MTDKVEFYFDGFDIEVRRSKLDGKLVVFIEGPDHPEDMDENGVPDIRVFLNEAIIHEVK